MSVTRYTEQQVLCGLNEFWLEYMGTDTPFNAATRIDLHMQKNNEWDDTEFVYFFNNMAEFFHFEFKLKEWEHLFGFDRSISGYAEWEKLVGQHLTFGVLAQFIAERTPFVSFNPVIVMGRECLPAGVFYGIRDVVKNITEDSKRFAPSAKIIDVIHGKSLEKFWTQLRWITKHGVPDLSATWKNAGELGCIVGLLGIPVGIFIWLLTENSLSFFLIPLFCALIWWTFSTLYKNCVNPLPRELVTFRDLAMLIAAHDCDAVGKA